MSSPGLDRDYYEALACAFVRGRLAQTELAASHVELFRRPLEQLEPAELRLLLQLGRGQGLPLHRFKRTMPLPRVRKVLGLLRGLQPAELLDVGSGRGVFLWPLLDAFPWLQVQAIDRLEHRVRDILAVRAGGVQRLSAQLMDATELELPSGAVDVVSMLEVLEHIPAAGQALAEVCRVARRAVVLSVPSRPDNNPEHIHLFDQASLLALLPAERAANIKFDYVLNHMIVLIMLEGRR